MAGAPRGGAEWGERHDTTDDASWGGADGQRSLARGETGSVSSQHAVATARGQRAYFVPRCGTASKGRPRGEGEPRERTRE